MQRSRVHVGLHEAVCAFSCAQCGQRLDVGEPVVVREPTTIAMLAFLCEGIAPGFVLLPYTERCLRAAYAHT